MKGGGEETKKNTYYLRLNRSTEKDNTEGQSTLTHGNTSNIRTALEMTPLLVHTRIQKKTTGPETYCMSTFCGNEIREQGKQGFILDEWKHLDERPGIQALQNLREHNE
jgi:hypothetical protein